MKSPLRLLPVALLALATGCCSWFGPPVDVPPVEPTILPSMDPVAIANRMLISLLMTSPLGTVREPTAVAIRPLTDSPDPRLQRGLDLLAAKLAAEPRLQVVRDDQAPHFLLLPSIGAVPDGQQMTAVLVRPDQPDAVLWSYRHPLP